MCCSLQIKDLKSALKGVSARMFESFGSSCNKEYPMTDVKDMIHIFQILWHLAINICLVKDLSAKILTHWGTTFFCEILCNTCMLAQLVL